jgi:oligosaccharide repeat unit polymerase
LTDPIVSAVRKSAPWLNRIATVLVMLLLVLGLALALKSSELLVFGAATIILLLLASAYEFDYLHPAVAYIIPWLVVLAFSVFPISEYARPLGMRTYQLLLSVMFVWLIATARAPVGPVVNASARHAYSPMPELRRTANQRLTIAFAALYIFAIINIAIAGYVPIVSLIFTGDSRYAEFGIPSLQGAFYAYANALGCLAYYLYLRKRCRSYLWLFVSCLCIHIALVTRAHVLILLIEAFVIRCLLVGAITRGRLLIICLAGLVAFSVLGTLRSGEIKEIIGISQSYEWVPTSFIWLYAYSYFNVLNLENSIEISDAPYFDGMMLQQLLPSVLRPESTHEAALELPSLNVLSYIYPVYMDIGFVGVLVITALLGALTSRAYMHALATRRFSHVATYACLFFCALMSFFVNFWLQLPVIFQIVWFVLLDRLFFQRSNAETSPSNRSSAQGESTLAST